MLSIDELKAKAYDKLVELETARTMVKQKQEELMEINKEIRNEQYNPEKTETVEPKKH